MSTTYFTISDLGLLVTCYLGDVSETEAVEMRRRCAADPASAQMKAHIVDTSHLSPAASFPSCDVQELASEHAGASAPLAGMPMVIIAPQDHVYGFARMFEIVLGLRKPEAQVAVTRNWREAGNLLGQDLSLVEAEVARRCYEAIPTAGQASSRSAPAPLQPAAGSTSVIRIT
jgi:hypothetical protein